MTVLIAGSGAAVVVPVAPPAVYVAPMAGLTQTWTGYDGTVVQLTDPSSPVRLKKGVKGLVGSPFTAITTSSPAVPGSRFEDVQYDEGAAFWPVAVLTHVGQEWFDTDAEFRRTLHRTLPGVWAVRTPDGHLRSRQLRFRGYGDHAFDVDPGGIGWAMYGLTFASDSPFWAGEPVLVGPFRNDDTTLPTFPAPGADYVLYLTSGLTLSAAKVTNPGEVPVSPVWTLTGGSQGMTSAVVGVDGKTIQVPFGLASGRRLTIDTSPETFTATLDDGSDVTALLGEVNFATVPPGSSVPLSLSMVGTGSISLQITPQYHDAW